MFTHFCSSHKNRILVLPEIIDFEVNLLVFSFFTLTRSSLKRKSKTEYKDFLKEEIKNLKLDQTYHSLNPDKQKEIDLEAENRLDYFWKSQLNKERSKGKLSKILQAALDEKRREIIKEWIESGRINV